MYRYEIKALYTPTNRIRTTTIEAQNREDAIARLKMDMNFSEPFVIEEFFDEPTSRQLDYAKDLKIKIPKHASIRDVAALIDRAINHDSDPNPGLIEFAKNRRILFSQYIGKKALYNRVFYELSERDKIAFFAFCVYRHVSDDRHANLDTHPKRQLFYDFAAEKEKDERFTKSMSKYSGEDIRFFGTIKFPDGGEVYGGSISTIAYKTCVDFLQRNCGAHLNTSIPGDGIYKRSKISGGTRDKTKAAVSETEMANEAEIVETQNIINHLRSEFERWDLPGKNVVIIYNTFQTYLGGIITNILNSIGAKTSLRIKQTTNCVLVGDKKSLPDYVVTRMGILKSKGTTISVFCLDSNKLSLTPVELELNGDKVGYNRTLTKIAKIITLIAALFLLIIVLIASFS